jgi:mono/diheme cytochrome c family protein
MAGADMFPAVGLVHDLVHLRTVERDMTADYGRYLAGVCIGCHGRDYSGMDDSGPNLTPDPETGLDSWTLDDFKRAFQQGQRPDGAVLDSAMPWYMFAAMTEDEVEALWMFLEELDPIVGIARTAHED